MRRPSPAPYHTIFLDWDGTLCLDRFWLRWADSPETGAWHQYLQNSLFGSDMNLVEAWMRGQLSSEQCLAQLADQLRIPLAQLLIELQASAETMQFADPIIPQFTQRLRERGVRVVIATNNMDAFWRWTMPSLHLEEEYDDILDSARLGCLKEDGLDAAASPFFGAYLERNHIEPSQTLLIDDSTNCVAAARHWGINAIKIDRGGLVPVLQRVLLA